jgi:hypothetical protein
MWRNMTGAWALVACAALLTGTGAAAQAATGPGAVAPGGTAVAGGARTVGSGGGWGKVTGVAARGGIYSVSCVSAGNCAAGGTYADSADKNQAFVVSQTHGTWQKPAEVAGALNTGGHAVIGSVSCASAGNCSAGGHYTDSSGNNQAFVVSQANGTWQTAVEVAGTLNAGGDAYVSSVSCAAAGYCSAGGQYTDVNGNNWAFVINETDGTWGKAKQVAAHLGGSEISSVSCVPRGYCSAGGDSGVFGQAFVLNQTHGVWGTPVQIAGAHSTGEFAGVSAVSCTSAGNCSAGGYYDSSSRSGGPDRLFVVSETNGTWGTARQLLAGRNTGQFDSVDLVSCASAGNCSASGQYTNSAGHHLWFVINQTHGSWGRPEVISAGPAATTTVISSVSCASAGNCSAGGFYQPSVNVSQALVINETDGTWGKPVQVATALNTGAQANVASVSCIPAGYCSAGGAYTGKAGTEAFIISKP